jgi:hypothetical protein
MDNSPSVRASMNKCKAEIITQEAAPMLEKPAAAHEIGTLRKRTWFHVAGLDPATAAREE